MPGGCAYTPRQQKNLLYQPKTQLLSADMLVAISTDFRLSKRLLMVVAEKRIPAPQPGAWALDLIDRAGCWMCVQDMDGRFPDHRRVIEPAGERTARSQKRNVLGVIAPV